MGRGRYQNDDEEQSHVIDGRAPYADTSKNIPISGRGPGGLTDPLVWANQFRRADSQITALPGPGSAPPATTAPSITDSVVNAVTNAATSLGNDNPLSFASAFNSRPAATAAPSLQTLAQSGPNHANDWMTAAAAGRNRVSAFMDRSKPTYTIPFKPVMSQREDLSGDKFGFGSAFR